jgi:hypothetical protein
MTPYDMKYMYNMYVCDLCTGLTGGLKNQQHTFYVEIFILFREEIVIGMIGHI